MQLLIPFAFVMIFTHVPYQTVPTAVRGLIHGIIWPKYWVEESDEKEKDLSSQPLLLLDTVDIVSMDIIFNLSVMLTFGICSPILALAIGLSCFFKLQMWTLFIGRLVSYFTRRNRNTFGSHKKEDTTGREDSKESDHQLDLSKREESVSDFEFPYTLRYLATTCIPIFDILDQNSGILLGSSTIFLSLLVWDIVGDDFGWKNSLWAPIIMISIPFMLYRLRKWNDKRIMKVIPRKKSIGAEELIEMRVRKETIWDQHDNDQHEKYHVDIEQHQSDEDSSSIVSNPIITGRRGDNII